MPVTEAIVNELTSQQLGNRDSKRIRKISQQQQLQQQQQNLNNNNYQQHNNNINDAEQSLINHNENHKYTNLVSMTTKNDKVATISIKETPISNGPVEKSMSDTPIDADENKTLRVAFFLSIAYSANIGGTGTLTGTGPNLVLQGIMDEYYPNLNDLSFGKHRFAVYLNSVYNFTGLTM